MSWWHYLHPADAEGRVQQGPELPTFTQESRAALDHSQATMCYCRELSRTKEPSILGQKKTKSGLPEAEAAPHSPCPPSPITSWAWSSCPSKSGSGPDGLPTGRWPRWQRWAAPHRARPVSFRVEEQRAFTGCNPGRGEKNGQVYRELGSHEGKEQAVRALLAQGLGSGPHPWGSRRSLAASEGPICVHCQQRG